MILYSDSFILFKCIDTLGISDKHIKGLILIFLGFPDEVRFEYGLNSSVVLSFGKVLVYLSPISSSTDRNYFFSQTLDVYLPKSSIIDIFDFF